MTEQIETHAAQSNGRLRPMPPPGTRTAEEIRSDIVARRRHLSSSVGALRTRWAEVTDVKRQIREHRTELMVGAAAVGFLVGGAIALSRRRR